MLSVLRFAWSSTVHNQPSANNGLLGLLNGRTNLPKFGIRWNSDDGNQFIDTGVIKHYNNVRLTWDRIENSNRNMSISTEIPTLRNNENKINAFRRTS